MANLGTIATKSYGRQMWRYPLPLSVAAVAMTAMTRANARKQWVWTLSAFDETGSLFAQAGNSVIAGAVTEGGVPVARCIVRLYYRLTGALVRTALTAPDGTFAFRDLATTSTQAFFAVAFDPAGGVQYNAVIFDRLTPA